MPGTNLQETIVENENIGEDNSFEERLQTQKVDSQDNTIIFVIVGIIAVISIGVIVKIKKN